LVKKTLKKKNIIFYLLIFLILIFLDTPFNKNSSDEHLFDSYRLKTNEFFLNKNSYYYLINKLENADNNLIPKYESNPQGGGSYKYKKTNFSPELSISEIEEWINNPPKFNTEKNFILEQINLLDNLDIKIALVNFENNKIAAEWVYAKKFLKINIQSIQNGTKVFAKILNHEIIHIAQSCNGGKISSKPILLGLEINLNKEEKYLLGSKIYKNKSKKELNLEKEAYSHQKKLDFGTELITKHCF
jgi:hypothetical protein